MKKCIYRLLVLILHVYVVVGSDQGNINEQQLANVAIERFKQAIQGKPQGPFEGVKQKTKKHTDPSANSLLDQENLMTDAVGIGVNPYVSNEELLARFSAAIKGQPQEPFAGIKQKQRKQ